MREMAIARMEPARFRRYRHGTQIYATNFGWTRLDGGIDCLSVHRRHADAGVTCFATTGAE
jgi:hypothetical protein